MNLLELIGPGITVLDLADDPETESDVAGYVERRLMATPVWNANPHETQEVARQVAQVTATHEGTFLLAWIITGRLRRAPTIPADWRGWTEMSAEKALEEDLAMGKKSARDLLAAIAFAEGAGLPARNVWSCIANTLSPNDAYTEDDIDFVLRDYGQYLVESGEAGEAVYRLYHERLIGHLRQTNPLGDGAPNAIAQALLDLNAEQTDSGQYPNVTNPYLVRHLATYAANGGEKTLNQYRQLANANPRAYMPTLAQLLDDLAAARSQNGEHAGAMQLAGEAVSAYTLLAEAQPIEYNHKLADALEAYSLRLGLLGLWDRALKSSEEALRIRRELAAGDPAAYLPEIPRSLNNISVALTELGHTDQGLQAIYEAVSINRKLAEENADAYLPDLATSLDVLSSTLGRHGGSKEALPPVEESVAIRQRLAESNPARYLPDLATSLYDLSTRLNENQRPAEALDAARGAVGTYDQFSTILVELGRHEDAVNALTAKVNVDRDLVEINPAEFLPDFADSLKRLSKELSLVDRPNDAIEQMKGSADAYERLIKIEPQYRAKLSDSLYQLADQLHQVGRSDEAVSHIRRAKELE